MKLFLYILRIRETKIKQGRLAQLPSEGSLTKTDKASLGRCEQEKLNKGV